MVLEDTADFSSYIESLANRVNYYLEQGYSINDIAILHIRMARYSRFSKTASRYDVLGKVKWYGTDGAALSSRVC